MFKKYTSIGSLYLISLFRKDVHRELPRLCVFIPITPVIHRAARVAADQDGHGGG